MPKLAYFNKADFAEIGSVLFRKSNKARRIIIYVKSPTKVIVSVPQFETIVNAESFVRQNIDRIKKRQDKYSKKIRITKMSHLVSVAEKLELIKRVEYLANKYQFTYQKVTLKKMRSRWGSCSALNNISLNIGLVALPDELKNYVILHELVHTRIKNHSVEFWNKLNSIVGNAKFLNKQLNQEYGLYEL